MNELTVDGIVKNAFAKGIKNIVPLMVNILLWILTVWIPYLNVGTTIGLFWGITAKMAKEETISMTEIFNPIYRKRMGEFFLVCSFVGMGIYIGFIFFIIPGIVIMIAWSLAIFLVIDKEETPIDSITKSNSLTYGKKWVIFFGNLIVILLCVVVIGILTFIFSEINPMLGSIVSAACFIVYIGLSMAANAYIYEVLVD